MFIIFDFLFHLWSLNQKASYIHDEKINIFTWGAIFSYVPAHKLKKEKGQTPSRSGVGSSSNIEQN